MKNIEIINEGEGAKEEGFTILDDNDNKTNN